MSPNKNPLKFYCENCDYNTSNKKDFNKHVKTIKHKSYINPTRKIPKKLFSCECGKLYKHSSTLYAHKKKCKYVIPKQDDAVMVKEMINNPDEKITSQYINMIDKLTQDNMKLVNTLATIAKEPKTVNNKMTINMYLNDKCSDAIDFLKFIEDIQISRAQLMYTKEFGLAKGVTNVIIKELKEMEETERPIHCTDKKRQQFYIKDGNWKKDDIEDTMNKAVYGLSHKHFAELQEWDKEHDKAENETEDNLYLDIAKQCANTKDEAEKNAKKVMKAISDKIELNIKPT